MTRRTVGATICLAVVVVALLLLVRLGGNQVGDSRNEAVTSGSVPADEVIPEPTRDYSHYSTMTPPPIEPWATTDPADGLYVGLSAAEVAEALRSKVAQGDTSTPTTVMYSVDIGPEDAAPFGLDPENISEDGSPDVGLILHGHFEEFAIGAGPGPTVYHPYVLVLVDRINGAYTQLTSDDYSQLRSLLP